MIKRFWCWLWGHKLRTEKRRTWYTAEDDDYKTAIWFVENKVCPRCGQKLEGKK